MKRFMAVLFVIALLAAVATAAASAGRYSSGCTGLNIADSNGQGWHGSENANFSACD
jgi:hypothetical protein